MKALLLIDIQNDFLPGGSLAVANGDEVVTVANRLMQQYELVVATQDWHPPDHQSFASQHSNREIGDIVTVDAHVQVLWPDHCVQQSRGADFALGLNTDGIDRVIRKGTKRTIDSYSGFFDNARRHSTELLTYLQGQSVDEIDMIGLATDYCVKFTALDAIDLGFRTTVLKEGIRGVELNPGDCQRAITEMRDAGVAVR